MDRALSLGSEDVLLFLTLPQFFPFVGSFHKIIGTEGIVFEPLGFSPVGKEKTGEPILTTELTSDSNLGIIPKSYGRIL